MQAVVPSDCDGFESLTGGGVGTGASLVVSGTLEASPGGKQGAVEVAATRLRVLGGCDGETYPLQKKKHSLEYLRSVAHLRARTSTIGAAARVRSCLALATHAFFASHGFLHVHTPIITASDAEGAGEMFQVTTLLASETAAPQTTAAVGPSPEALRQQVADAGAAVREAKAGRASADAGPLVVRLLELKASLAAAEAAPLGRDYRADFFGKKAFLTVSGQLNAEAYACALRDVYTFGPTFRAENSNTARHLAEFWMVEPELAFADLSDDMDCAEAYLKHCLAAALSSCDEDLAFFEALSPGSELRARLAAIAAPGRPFARMTYTAAVDALQAAAAGGSAAFEFPVIWGKDLQSEHERWLCEKLHGGAPVIVHDYPADCKAFYMRANDDGKTVAAMDVLVPRVGELMGGSQREERLSVLEAKMEAAGVSAASLSWYCDLRRYGTVPHAGFGLGFERLVQYTTGLDNIRDAIAFPRHPGSAEF